MADYHQKGPDMNIDEKAKQVLDEPALTMSTASRTNFDPSYVPQPLYYDNIFNNSKYTSHPRYMDYQRSPLGGDQLSLPDFENIDDIFNPEVGYDEQIQIISTPRFKKTKESPMKLKESSVKIFKGAK